MVLALTRPSLATVYRLKVARIGENADASLVLALTMRAHAIGLYPILTTRRGTRYFQWVEKGPSYQYG